MAAESAEDVVAELEHLIGFSSKFPLTCLGHPQDPNLSIYTVGSLVVLRDLTDPHKQDFLRYHDGEVSALAVSPGGEYIASGQTFQPKGLGSPLVLWDVATRKRLFELTDLTGDCQFAHFSPDTKLIAAGDDKGFYIWDLDTGDLILSQKADRGQNYTTLCWGSIHEGRSKRNPSYLLATTSSSTLLLHLLAFDIKSMRYGLQTSNVALPSRGWVRRYTAACFSDDRQLLFAATTNGDVAVFNVPNAVFRLALNVGANGVNAIASRGSSLFAGAGDGTLRKFEMQGRVDTQWVQTAEGALGGRVLALTLLADGDLLALTQAGQLSRLRADDLSAALLAEAAPAPLTAIAFPAARSDQVATAGSDGAMRVWDLNTYLASAWAPPPAGAQAVPVTALAYAADSNSLIAGYADGRLSGLSAAGDPRSGQAVELWNVPVAHRGPVTCLTASERLLLSGGGDGLTRVWLASSRQLVTQLNPHGGKPLSGVQLDVRQPHLVHSCGADRSVCVFDLRSEGRVVTHQLGEKAANMTCLAQRADSEQESITGTTDGRICFWDVDVQPDPVATLADPARARINALALAPGGRYLAAACDDATVKLFDIQQMSLLAVLAAHSAAVTGLAWSPDQRQLVSVASDSTIAVWNFYLD